MRRTAAETREHVLRVARDLFYWEGIRATGVDRVAAAAGVAPTTLYRLFASKDDLVAAYVERESRLYREWFAAALEAGGPDPRARILALFDALSEQVQPDRCRGCPFQMTLAELPEPDLAAHQGAVDTKAWVRSRLEELTAELAQPASASAPAADPAELADQLAVIIEGVYASVASLGAEGPARRARALAERLLGG
ncbi:MAG: TetR/AcrR family transcriptional regulator [bacterium]|jgi:AcrR family transcriptional regulator|nr:TetR/AcrR family transcriptional regulator [bacterium]